VVADGTADQLKSKVGQARLRFSVADRAGLPMALRAVAPVAVGEAHVDEQRGTVTLRIADGMEGVAAAAAALRDAAVPVADFGLRQPTLDDVFLHLTGNAPAASGTPTA
jgi:ABC-2 type transport system ATP-binding protein